MSEWGEVKWLVNAELNSGAEQTFGLVTILPGRQNPLHMHPNCEEILYVLSGECDHRLGPDTVHLAPGEVIRIPREVPHFALCTSDAPMVAVISFSSGERQAVFLSE
jgi:quercetin dioxygenase-like cupin family protein